MLKRSLLSGISSVYLLSTPILVMAPSVGWAQLEEIIVTTRRRAENLQEVPIAVTAFTAEMINKQGIRNLTDITRLDPSVSFDTSYNSADTRVNIRGLSATRGRSNVAFLVDGIDVTSENTITAGSGLLANRRLLNDVERIEVVKGSQSALFGRSAFSGAISYVTKEPGDEFEGNVRLDAGQDGFFEGSAAAGGPIPGLEDVLGMRLTGVYWTQDGWWEDANTGVGVGGGDGWGGAWTTVFTPTENLKFKTRIEYSEENYDPAPIVRAVQRTPTPYPETTITRLNAEGQIDSDAALAGGYGTSTSGMPDHGLFCSEVLPPEVTEFDERQLALKELYPDYPTMPAHVPVQGLPHPDDNVKWKLALSDGSDPLRPGFCLPSTFGDSSDKPETTFSEDPATGGEFNGVEADTFRATLLAEWDFDHGTYSWNSGYTDQDGSVENDQDFQTEGFPDTLNTAQGGNATKEIEQVSSEIRFSSSWDGPLQMTLGGLYWHEERTTGDRNWIIDCFRTGKNSQGLVLDIPGLCDGTDGTLDNYQDYWQQLQPHAPSSWEAETDHWSAYVMFEFDLAENWKVTFEDRYVDEDFDLSKPNFSSCTSFAFGIGGGAIAKAGAFVDESLHLDADGNVLPEFDQRCTSDRYEGEPMLWDDLPLDIQALYTDPANVMNLGCENASGVLMPGYPLAADGQELIPFGADPSRNALDAATPGGTDPNTCPWGNISGTTDSSFHVPKVTLEWTPTDDAMVYFSYAKARKPAGINQITSGGSATTIDDERFDAEIMDSYEIGTKTAWEAAGYLQLNGSLFFQDYTDKQVGTQILTPDGQGGFRSNPRVVNASAAEVWGVEFDVLWQPVFADGLTLSAAYTYLDTEYVDFEDETTNFVRAAMNGSCPVIWTDSNGDTVATGTTNPNTDPDNPQFAPKCSIPLSGNNLERAPENAFVGSVAYTRQLGASGFDWFVGLDAIYQDERWADQDNFVKWDDYWVADARLGFEAEAWTILFYVDNVFDDDTIKSGGSGPDVGPAISDMGFSAGLIRSHFFGPLPMPRNFGVRLNYNF